MRRPKEKLLDKVGKLFKAPDDNLPYCDQQIISACEKEVAEALKCDSDQFKKECSMRLSWALVHSRRSEDVKRGIALIESALYEASNPLTDPEKLHLLGVGYYRSGDYIKSKDLVEKCLESSPDWKQAMLLKKAIEDKITRDGAIGIGVAASAVGLVAGGLMIAGGIAAALVRNN